MAHLFELHWQLYFTVFCLGAFFNLMRGTIGKAGKHGNDLAFGLLCGVVKHGIFLQDWSWSQWNDAAWYWSAMYLGRSLGWGEYIGAMINNRINNGNEVGFIDKAFTWALNRPVLWGFLTLSVRGALWGYLVALSLHSIWPVLAGATMGAIYFCTIKTADLQDGKLDTVGANKGWSRGELVFGGVFWCACIHAIVAGL